MSKSIKDNGNNRSEISDTDVASFVVNMNSEQLSKENFTKSEEKETLFDSGILSGTNLSSSISDIDLKCLSKDDNCKSNETDVHAAVTQFSDNDIKSEKDSMRIDSGIDIDVSDQFHDSKYSCELVVQKSDKKSKSVIKDVSHSKNWPREKLSSKVINYSWKSLFQQNKDGDTHLHLAVIQRHEKMINHMLQCIRDPKYLNIQNFYFQTCLHLSVLSDQPRMTRLLFLAGVDTGIEDRNGNTALHLACKAGNLECVKALLDPVVLYEQKYTTFNYIPQINSPFEYINDYNYDGLTCLHIAAEHQDSKILHQLFMYGADVNIRECKGGNTILHEAVKVGNLNLVNFILQHSGIDIDKQNYARLTAYQLSGYYSNIGKVLLEKGAKQLVQVEEESDDYESSDESDSEDEYNASVSSSGINQISSMIYSLNVSDSSHVMVTC